MKKGAIFIITLFAFAFAARAQSTVHNSRDSLAWDGIYQGVLPCADCEGVQTIITLSRNLNYTVKTKYLGKSDTTFTYSGSFSWNKEGNMITLKKASGGYPGSYLVSEGTLTQLDGDKKIITGPMAAMFVLSKSAYALLGKYWKLVELNGHPISADSNLGREPFLQFNGKTHRVTGNAGCNNISGGFKLSAGNRISLSQIISTRMACDKMEMENQFLQVLGKIDQYAVNGDMLVFSRAKMAPLARFRLAVQSAPASHK